jgi:hypothetical protein
MNKQFYSNKQINKMKKITIYLVIMLALPVLLQAQYFGGNGRGDASIESLSIPLAIAENYNNTIPASCSLHQNYPNPFNPATNIKFNVAQSTDVKIVVYDIIGREVQTLVNESLKPGTYAVSFDGSSLNSGVYFYKITARGYSETKRMMLEK